MTHMLLVRRLALVCSTLTFLAACQAKEELRPEPKKVKKEIATKSKKESEGKAKEHAAEPRDPQKFVVPFAWEAAQDEPLAQTRLFMKDSFIDNDGYMEHGDKFFAEFADKETPRATVITCADSRVNTNAWDATPENDAFTIRNIGNVVENSAGSIEYGVEQLETPLLLVVGHTGCGAVRAAMGDTSKLPQAIQDEVSHVHPPKPAAGASPTQAWADAVIGNVNNQVSFALGRFGKRVQEGKLTVVGAVYDFRNDLGQGPGKFVVVNVNGNAEPARMSAFVDAVNGVVKEEKSPKEARGKGARTKANSIDDAAIVQQISSEIAKVHGVTVTGGGKPKEAAHGAHGHE